MWRLATRRPHPNARNPPARAVLIAAVMSFMNGFRSAALAIAMSAGMVAAPAMARASVPIEQTARAPVQPSTLDQTELAGLAQRAEQSKQLEQYQAGDPVTIVVSSSVLGLFLIIILLILLLR